MSDRERGYDSRIAYAEVQSSPLYSSPAWVVWVAVGLLAFIPPTFVASALGAKRSGGAQEAARAAAKAGDNGEAIHVLQGQVEELRAQNCRLLRALGLADCPTTTTTAQPTIPR